MNSQSPMLKFSFWVSKTQFSQKMIINWLCLMVFLNGERYQRLASGRVFIPRREDLLPTNTTQNCDHTLYIDDTKSIAIELLKRKSNFTSITNERRNEKKRKLCLVHSIRLHYCNDLNITLKTKLITIDVFSMFQANYKFSSIYFVSYLWCIL